MGRTKNSARKKKPMRELVATAGANGEQGAAPATHSDKKGKKPKGERQQLASREMRQTPPQKKAAADTEDDDDESSSSGEDSDAGIGLTASGNVKATVKAIAPDAPMKPSAADAAAASAAAAAERKKVAGQKRKAAAAADEAAAAADEDDDEDEDDKAGASATASADGSDEIIEVEFGLYDPKPLDYLTLKMLLKDYVHGPQGGKKKKQKAAAAAAAADEEAGEDGEEEGTAAAATASASAVSSDVFALHELCAALSSQAAVGSTMKGEGTDEPLGFLSLLNLAWQEQHARNEQSGQPVQWVVQLRKYVLRHAPPQHRAAVEAALRDPRTGLLIQSRLLNAPPQMVPHLHQALLDDLDWAASNALLPIGDSFPTPPPSDEKQLAEATQAYRDSFNCQQLLFIGRTFKPAPGAAKQKQIGQQFVSPFASKKKQKKAAAQTAGSAAALAPGEFDWLRFEEELYAKAATVHFTVACPYTSEDAAAGRVPQRCEFMLLPQSALQGIVQQLQLMAAS